MIKDFLFIERGYPYDLEYCISELALLDTIIRVDKRKAYYDYFHGMTINESKVAGLFAYWILKFKPITLLDSRFSTKTEHIDVNELFALYFIYETAKLTGKCNIKITGRERYITELRYSFRFRNFSIGSLVVLAESFNNETITQA